MDGRRFNGRPRKLDFAEETIVTSHAQLQSQCHLPLRRRVAELRLKYRISLTPSTLRRYYRRQGIRFKSVDLNNLNKEGNRAIIQAEQQRFVIDIKEARQ